MRFVISCVVNYEEQFRQAMGEKHKSEAKRELAARRKQYVQAERHIEELHCLFKRIYEECANEKLSDSRYEMLSKDYEQEQIVLRDKLLQLEEEITQQEEQAENIDRFMGKYVHAPVKEDGERIQDVDISYNLIGILPYSLLMSLRNEETA